MNVNRPNSEVIALGVFIIAIVLSIVYIKLHIAICLLTAFFLLSYSIAKFIKNKNKFDLNDGLMLFIPMLISVLFIVIPFDKPPIKKKLNQLYFSENNVYFEKEIKILNSNFQNFIFAFDNSKGLKGKLNKESQGQYDSYCDEIERLSWVGAEERKIQQFRKDNSYGNFLKARLCFDLIQRENDKNKFIILKIGDPNSSYWKNYDEFIPLKMENIREAIQKIIQTKNDELHTNFQVFNDKLKNIKSSIGETKLIILYTYSDFFHDCEGVESEDDINLVKKDKQEIIGSIIHICFIDNHPSKREGRYILDSKPDFAYERFFFLDSIDKKEKIPIRVTLKNKKWFYLQEDDEEDINTTFVLNFPQCEKYICSHNTINNKDKDTKIFRINGKISDKGETSRYFGYEDTIITLQYEGKNLPAEKTLFEIIHNDIHYYVYFQFIKELNRSLRIWLPGLIFTLGFLMGLGDWWKKK
ncbi:MAG: hypothetical protein LBT70_03305 [Holosporaceae bacterium]|jgi:hypothetical protein|nr:hypothetical protein [Holosporaceae bacterium]